jgi:hypothetical protein
MFASEAVSAVAGEGYQVENACLFESTGSDSTTDALTRTFGTPTNNGVFTYSLWVKRWELKEGGWLLGAGPDSANYTYLGYPRFGNDEIKFGGRVGNNDRWGAYSGSFRDPADYAHIVVAVDSSEASDSDKVKLWVDNVLQNQNTHSFSTPYINSARKHTIGYGGNIIGSQHLSSYMAEVVFIDGQALDPTAFGAWNKNAPNVWQPKDLSQLNFSGNNSFYLDFADPNDLGKDVSGNGNSWTRQSITSANHVTDTPTNNAAILNPIDTTTATLSNGSRKLRSTSNAFLAAKATFGSLNSGKWYMEYRVDEVSGGTNRVNVGFGKSTTGFSLGSANGIGSQSDGVGINRDDNYWRIYNRGSFIKEFSNLPNTNVGAILQLAIDIDAGSIWIGINNTWDGDPSNGTGAVITDSFWTTDIFPMIAAYNTGSGTARFNPDEFTYAPPTGFLPLTSKNLPKAPVPYAKKYFDPQIFAGSPTGQDIETVNKVDHVVIKSRGAGWSWQVFDTERGVQKALNWDAVSAEATANGVMAFGAESGFTLGNDITVHDNGGNMLALPFTKDPIAGMDIVPYTPNGSPQTIAHNLGKKPKMMIVRTRDAAVNTMVYLESLGATKNLFLDASNVPSTDSTVWNNTEPTDTHFTIGSHSSVSGGTTGIAYLFADIEGFIKVIEWTGNGNHEGTFVYTGFKTNFLILKCTDITYDWWSMDAEANKYNPWTTYLSPSTASAEATVNMSMDILANGLKMRTNHSVINGNGNKYVGIAFAENPFGLKGTARGITTQIYLVLIILSFVIAVLVVI